MDLPPFEQDIDELIDEFAQGEFTTLDDMKKVWLSRKFSYIYTASPTTNLAFFMQSLYAHAIGHMVNTVSLSHRLGGLYCLYCLHETQPFKPPFRIYISLRELGELKKLVVEAKEKGIKVVAAVVKRMLEKNMFIFGSVDLNKSSIAETINQLMELQNARVRLAYERLLADTRIEHFLHMDMGTELDLDVLRKMDSEYAKSKKRAIEGASQVVDVQNIKHISEDKKLIGETAEQLKEEWNAQKEAFCQQTGLMSKNDDDDDGFDELKQLLFKS